MSVQTDGAITLREECHTKGKRHKDKEVPPRRPHGNKQVKSGICASVIALEKNVYVFLRSSVGDGTLGYF